MLRILEVRFFRNIADGNKIIDDEYFLSRKLLGRRM